MPRPRLLELSACPGRPCAPARRTIRGKKRITRVPPRYVQIMHTTRAIGRAKPAPASTSG